MVFRGIALVSLLFALLAVWYRREAKRAFWVGYLHGGGAYALLTFYALGGMTNNPVWNDQQIVSGELAKLVYRWLPESKRAASTNTQEVRVWYLSPGGASESQNRTRMSVKVIDTMKTRGQFTVVAQPNAAAILLPPPNFRYLFHSIFVVLCGSIGGMVGVWAFKTRDAQRQT
jgi:hypothetical protein